AEDGIRDGHVTGVQTCALPIYGWPSLRFLSSATAFLVAVQVGYGAGFRHSAVGVIPHLLGALVVALFIMIVGAFATNQFPKHPRSEERRVGKECRTRCAQSCEK